MLIGASRQAGRPCYRPIYSKFLPLPPSSGPTHIHRGYSLPRSKSLRFLSLLTSSLLRRCLPGGAKGSLVDARRRGGTGAALGWSGQEMAAH